MGWGREGWNPMKIRSLRVVHTKKRGTSVTNKEWRGFWKEMESQQSGPWLCEQLGFGGSGGLGPILSGESCAGIRYLSSVACGLYGSMFLRDSPYVPSTIFKRTVIQATIEAATFYTRGEIDTSTLPADPRYYPGNTRTTPRCIEKPRSIVARILPILVR